MTKAFILIDSDIKQIEDVSNELKKTGLEFYPLLVNMTSWS